MERWKKQEDRVLFKQIEKYPYNLTKAFTETARIIGRSKDACRLRWYCHKADDPETVCFATVCRRGSVVNRKSRPPKKKPKGWWHSIKKLLKI